MNRVWKLAKVLRMSGGGTHAGKNKKGLPVGTMTILMLILTAAACVGAGWVGFKLHVLEEFVQDETMGYLILRVFFALGTAACFMFSIPTIVNTFYMSSDLPVILVMPYTPMQIVMARVINLCPIAIMISLVVSLPAGICYSLTRAVEPSFYIALVLAFVAIPVIALSLACIIVMLIMNFVRIMRNTDHLRVIGILLGVAIYVAYVYGSEKVKDLNNKDAIVGLTRGIGKIEIICPVNFALKELMTGLSVLAIAEILAIAGALAAIFFIVAKCFYLNGAISMQTTSGVGRNLDGQAIKRFSKKKSAVASKASVDFTMVRRNPAYLLQGFIYPFGLPFLMIITGGNSISQIVGNMNDIINVMKEIPGARCLVGISAAIYLTLISNSLNSIITTPLSREGENFLLMKQFPFTWKDFISAKQRVSLRIGNMTSSLYTLIAMLGLLMFKFIDIPAAICMVVMHVALLFLVVDCAFLKDLSNPHLDWESEAAMIKKSNGALSFIWLIASIAAPIGLLVAVINIPDYLTLLVAACMAAAVGAAIAVNIILYKKGPAMLEKL